MTVSPRRKASPDLSRTRTNSDWIMVVLGIFLVVLFLVAGYFSYVQTDAEHIAKPRGPVKDPKNIGPGSSIEELNLFFRIAGNRMGHLGNGLMEFCLPVASSETVVRVNCRRAEAKSPSDGLTGSVHAVT